MLTSSTQLQKRSFHVIERTRTSSKCQKMKTARAKRAKILFSIVKYANLLCFCSRRGCEELIVFLQMWKPQFLSVVQFPFDSCHSPFSPTTFFEIGVCYRHKAFSLTNIKRKISRTSSFLVLKVKNYFAVTGKRERRHENKAISFSLKENKENQRELF